MISVLPISEEQASESLKALYGDIRQTLKSSSVPIMFQYLAFFPEYLHDIWKQAKPNIQHQAWSSISAEMIHFADEAIDTVYTPAPRLVQILTPIRTTSKAQDLRTFSTEASLLNATLYLLSVSLRESLKGKYLGLKQLGKSLSQHEREEFNSFSNEFSVPASSVHQSPPQAALDSPDTGLVKSSQAITQNTYQQFFRLVDKEMTNLLKKETYLAARVELERFTLAKLPLIPSPINSSFAFMSQRYFDNPQFSELIYLVAEVFPTQTPYKLMASSVMKKLLSPPPPEKK